MQGNAIRLHCCTLALLLFKDFRFGNLERTTQAINTELLLSLHPHLHPVDLNGRPHDLTGSTVLHKRVSRIFEYYRTEEKYYHT
jgi:hypothetical protein